MTRIALLAIVAVLAAPAAHAGFFQSCSTTGCTTTKTPDYVYVPPAKPIFSTTVETRRKDNGDRVRVTTTYRDGIQWTKERAVIHSGRGIGDAGKSRNRNR